MLIELVGAERVDDLRELWLELHHHHRALAAVPLVADDALSWQRRRALYLERLSTDRAFLVCAVDGEAVVGYALVCLEDGPDDTFTVGERYAELYSLCVAEAARGRGLGTRVLDAVDAELAARGIEDLRVAVMIGNEGAKRLYERRGLVGAELVMYCLP